MKKELDKVRFSVEVEVEFPQAKDSYKLIRKHRLIRGWTIGSDGSLENGAEYKPKDKNKLHFNEDGFDQIREIIGLIKAHHGHIRRTCGLHVHIDMKDFNNKEIVNIVRAFIKEQNKIYKKYKVIKSRQENNAQKIPKEVYKLISSNIVDSIRKNEPTHENDYFNNRYYGLNLQSLPLHKSAEFRIFNGTIQAKKIESIVKWCIEFCIKNV